jgi:hypothetical protein
VHNAGEAETMGEAFMWREEGFGWSMDALLFFIIIAATNLEIIAFIIKIKLVI